jgi:glycosyltransferase involved in cell wall biosynthesis
VLSVVIPALNVEETIKNVIAELSKSSAVNEIVVVDNLSSDKTFDLALESGARVILCEKKGMGNTIKMGIKNANNNMTIPRIQSIASIRFMFYSLSSSAFPLSQNRSPEITLRVMKE